MIGAFNDDNQFFKARLLAFEKAFLGDFRDLSAKSSSILHSFLRYPDAIYHVLSCKTVVTVWRKIRVTFPRL